MGCEPSSSNNLQSSDIAPLRRDKKKLLKVHGRSSGQIKLFQNVKKIEDSITNKEQQKIFKIISKHFFFSGISHNQREQLIDHFSLYECKNNDYVFKQASPGSLFFIIKKGKVSIQINNKHIKSLSKNQCFGDLSLLYTAPRSASVRAEQNCIFWCLHQISFRSFSEQLASRNYKIAKPLLMKVPIFQFITQSQLNSLAYATNCEKYQKQQIVFKQGDDANSFYIVAEGSIKINIPNKDPVWLEKGQSFGQNCFQSLQIRSGTAISGPSKVILISISRQGLTKALGGNQLTQITQFNILRWSLVRSKIFRNIPVKLIPKIAEICHIHEYSDNQIIIKKKQNIKYFLVAIQGGINNYKAGQLVNQDYYLNENGDRIIQQFNDITNKNKNKNSGFQCKQSLKKVKRGLVFKIPISQLECLLGLDLQQTLFKKMRLFEEGAGVGFGDQYQVKTKKLKQSKYVSYKPSPQQLKKITLKTLKYHCKLGEGQFGKVFLVEDANTSVFYALKCIKKKEINQFGMENFVKSQKSILQTIDHPLIVKLYKTFKDEAFIYLLMEYIQGWDFFDVLREIGLCSSEITQFYLACLILSIQQLHSKNIIYRDLKPQNAVVDRDGYIRLVDMGAAKKLQDSNGYRTFTVIGTPHYMAPEIIQGKGYSFQSDIWSLGIIMYEMVCGKLPFGQNQDDPYQIYKKVMNQQTILYPSFYTSKKGKKLLEKLLDFNSSRRNFQNFQILKKDEYFQNTSWQLIKNNGIKAPYKPKKKNKNLLSSTKSPKPFIHKFLQQQINSSKISKQDSLWDKQF